MVHEYERACDGDELEFLQECSEPAEEVNLFKSYPLQSSSLPPRPSFPWLQFKV